GKGTLVVRFPVGEHTEDAKTIWHRIVGFNSLADALRARAEAGELTKGREVRITGYERERSVTGKDGKTRQEPYVSAVVVSGKDQTGHKWSVSYKKPASQPTRGANKSS